MFLLLRLILILIFTASACLADTPQSTTQLKEVQIESTPLEESVEEEITPVIDLSEKEIQERAQPSLGETLSTLPGITSSFYGQGASRPIIRGQSGDRVKIMQNGIGIQDVSSTSPDHAVGLEPIQSDRVEVIRGPATLLYSPNILGGVVNVFDNRIPEEMPGKPLNGALDFRGGTVDWLRSAGGKIDLPLGSKFALHLDGFDRKSDDYKIPGYARSKELRDQGLPAGFDEEPKNRRPDSATDAQGGSVGSSYIFENGFIGAALNLFNTNYGLPTDERGVYIELHQRRFDLRARVDEPAESIKKIEFRSGIVDYQHREIDVSDVETVFKNNGIDSRLELSHQDIGPFKGLVGLQYQYSDFSAVGQEAFMKPTQTNTYSGFIFEVYGVTDSLSLQTGARLDLTDVRNIGYIAPASALEETLGISNAAISGGVSGVYQFPEMYSGTLSLSHTERAPTGGELFANGPHAGTAAFEIGDPNLDVEHSLGLDLNLSKNEGTLTGYASGFYSRFYNYITANPTGQIKDNLPEYSYEGFNADFFGAESQLVYHLLGPSQKNNNQTKVKEIVGQTETLENASDEYHHLDLIGQVDFVRAYDRDGNGDLPRIPPWRLLAAIDYQRESFGARAEVQNVFEQNDVASLETPTDGYTLTNLIFTYGFKMNKVDSTLFLRGNNLFDVEARSNTSFLKDLTPLPGRNIMAGLRFAY